MAARPAHAGVNDTEKARVLAPPADRAARAGYKSSGIEPTGLAFDWSRQILPQPYFVYEWIDGEPLWDDPDAHLYRAAGHALASLHRVRFDAFYADFFAIGNTPQAWADRFGPRWTRRSARRGADLARPSCRLWTSLHSGYAAVLPLSYP